MHSKLSELKGKENSTSDWLSFFNDKKRWQLGLFSLAHVLIIAVLYNTVYDIPYGSIGLYYQAAGNILEGEIPYLDFNLEYPPFSLFFFLLPHLLTTTYLSYAVCFTIEVIVFDLITVYLIYRTAHRLGKAPWKLLTVYTLCLLAIGPILAVQFDIFPAVMLLLSIYFFWIRKSKLSWTFLALGTLTKLYPAAIFPIFLIYYYKNRQFKQIWSGLIIFFIVFVVVLSPLIITGRDSIMNMIQYHMQRGLHLESIYSSFLLIADKLHLVNIGWEFNHGAYHLIGDMTDLLANLSTYIMLITLLIVYMFIYRNITPGKSQFTRLGAYSLLVITALLATSKILSPQYIIWLLPLFPLLLDDRKKILIAVFILIGILTYLIFPINYLDLIALNFPEIALLFFRNISLIILCLLCWGYLRNMRASD